MVHLSPFCLILLYFSENSLCINILDSSGLFYRFLSSRDSRSFALIENFSKVIKITPGLWRGDCGTINTFQIPMAIHLKSFFDGLIKLQSEKRFWSDIENLHSHHLDGGGQYRRVADLVDFS